MKYSFGSWALAFGPYSRDPIPLPEIAARLARAGYHGIEIGGFPPHVTLESFAGVGARRELTGMLADLSLEVSGYVPDLTSVNPLVPENRQRYLDLFRRNVDLCVDLNSPRVRVDTIAAPGSVSGSEYQEAMDRLASLWNEASALAADAGVRVAWEFEPGFLFNKPSEVVELYEQVGHPNFQILFDTCHAYVCGVVGERQHGKRETVPTVADFLDMLAGRVGHVHLTDADGSLYGDETSTHMPLGEGRIDFRKLAPRLKALPGVEWWCVDLAFWPGSWDLLEPSLAFLKAL